MHDQIRILTAQETPVQPWKNGGGLTRQLAIHPDSANPDDCIWRVSAAEINTSGPFSIWSGYDRILMMTDGDAIQLTRTDTGGVTHMGPGSRLYFAGETPYTAELLGGPAHDFNLMLRRKHAHGCVDLRRSAQAIALRPGETILHCTQGVFRLDFPPRMGGPRTLAIGDTLHLTLDYIPAFRLNIQPETPNACLVDARINLYPGTADTP
ncbi:MAG TPA: HutD family protein [Castellaniella sp.]|uniref:HutD/Ves family protein n=1 Tax=Castellaniella sp. TaxID=1955812 RepID=UPI002F1AF4E8